MLVIRPANLGDLDQLLDISTATGPGMTSMPADRDMWERRLRQSEASFSESSADTGNTYFMVLEDTESGVIAGSTAIYTGIGRKRPFYSYKVSTLVNYSSTLDRTVTHRVLHLVNDYTGATEIGSLYLAPEYRRDRNGAFISRSRYLLLAGLRDRFANVVIAEMRGWQDTDGESPFWEHLGKKFFGLAFENADYMNAVNGTQFISDLMPRYPIYVDLLAREAREVIGKPHTDSARALSLLLREGFYFADYVDIFDGGPTVQCRTDDIRSVQDARRLTVIDVVGDDAIAGAPVRIVSNDVITRYRIVRQPARIEKEGLLLGRSAATALGCDTGSVISMIEA
ncbi:MAG: arginine N-succinyltransferase [Proteobacteria bacterium]|nr:MAG: arginine N-succinyltransferase [Pseudomonadota bacterium]